MIDRFEYPVWLGDELFAFARFSAAGLGLWFALLCFALLVGPTSLNILGLSVNLRGGRSVGAHEKIGSHPDSLLLSDLSAVLPVAGSDARIPPASGRRFRGCHRVEPTEASVCHLWPNNEQRATSNERRATNDEQRTDCEQLAANVVGPNCCPELAIRRDKPSRAEPTGADSHNPLHLLPARHMSRRCRRHRRRCCSCLLAAAGLFCALSRSRHLE